MQYKPFIDVGTDISVPTSMIAAVIPFSLFTAYQFLSYDRLIDAPKSKMRPYPAWVNQWLCTDMMEMIASTFFVGFCAPNFGVR